MANLLAMGMAAMFLSAAGEPVKNPWTARVSGAIERAVQTGTPAAYLDALDVTWRADEWATALALAREVTKRWPDDESLRGSAVRAMWRAGRIDEAEKLAESIKPDSQDRVALTQLIQISSARGQHEKAEKLADRLETLGPQSAMEFSAILGPRLQAGRVKNMAELARKVAGLIDEKNGYPDIHLKEAVEGLPEFFAAAGDEPLNQIVGHGAADMPLIQMLGLPGVEAYLNGKGPYRFVVDTGGSIMLSLDSDIAEEIGLKSIAPSSVRGVSGSQDAGQAVLDDFQCGGIRMKRVMTRIWDLPAPMKSGIAGIIGTGMFSKGRMTLDWGKGKLVVSPSSDKPAPGVETELRLVGDAKLIAPIKLNGGYALALLDTGASTGAISPARLEELFPDKKLWKVEAPVMGAGDDGPTSLSIPPAVDVEYFGVTHSQVAFIGLDVLDTTLGPILGVQSQLLVGMPQFSRMRSLTVDYERCRMWVEWLK